MNGLVVIDVSDLEALLHRVLEKALRDHAEPVGPVLTPEQVGQHIGVSPGLVRSWARDLPTEERCPHMRAGKHYRFQLAAVLEWMKKRA